MGLPNGVDILIAIGKHCGGRGDLWLYRYGVYLI